MTRRSDDDLVEALEAASPKLLRYLLRHLEHREDAADALSEVLLAAWRRRRVLPAEPDRLNAWLFTAARHGIQSQRRTRGRSARLAERLRLELGHDPLVEPDPAERASEIDEVERALRRLPPETAELIRLVHWEGLTIAAAANVLDLSPSTARSRYQAARASLRAGLHASSTSVGATEPE